MYESAEELETLQDLLDHSRARATEHLREIINEQRVLSAEDIAALLTGMKVVALATVTSHGEPRISAVDGHFLHGTWTWSTSGTSHKARALERNTSVSVAHVDNEELAVFSHGTAQLLDASDPTWDETLRHWTEHYGGSPLEWGDDIRIYRLQPSWMVGYAFDRIQVLERTLKRDTATHVIRDGL